MEEKEEKEFSYSFETLSFEVKQTIRNILRTLPEELNLNYAETQKRIKQKTKLRVAARNSCIGDLSSKEYLKNYISDLLLTKFQINDITINKIFPFDKENELPIEVKFITLLYQFKKKYKYYALEKLILENHLDQMKQNQYFIEQKEIEQLYNQKVKALEFKDKLEVLCQLIYQNTFGLGNVDEIRDMKIEGVSGGMSGISENMFDFTEDLGNMVERGNIKYSFDSIWIRVKAKNIRLEFLSFHSQAELERICTNIYRYNSPGQLSESKGHIINDMKDGSRVSVARPPFSDSWIFIVRKHSLSKLMKVEELIKGDGAELPIELLFYLVRGCQIIAITGQQGCGKTALLRSLIEYIRPIYNLRIQESVFELSLRKAFPNRNIATFKEDGLVFQKKTDGDINILGEVANQVVAGWIIQMSQAASRMTMFSHHAKTTEDLIRWMRGALLKECGYTSEKAATEEVVHTINIDVHMESTIDGYRYIERISEIIPTDDEKQYQVKDLVKYNEKQQRYELNSNLSSRAKREINKYLTKEESKQMEQLFECNLIVGGN